ncbi:hypothetical protein BD309DRAFT_1083699 [Dichomitus squalens]|nr:hypothetical protein BD309DRAFT_1083699 [Dichomitus squalens]
MEFPEGYDPHSGFYEDPSTGQWQSFPAQPPPQRSGTPSVAQENRPPGPPRSQWSGPAPRPHRGGLGYVLAPSFPPPSSHRDDMPHDLHGLTRNLDEDGARGDQQSMPADRPLLRSVPNDVDPPHRSLQYLFDPEPSSRESSPGLSPPPTPRTSASKPRKDATPKLDKGKKRASDDSEPKTSKKPKAAAPPPKATTVRGKAKPAPDATEGSKQAAGRKSGSTNYIKVELDALLNVVKKNLPIGQAAWAETTKDYNKWAQANGRPARTEKPLKTKFDTLVRTPKPTGDAEIPPHVERAWEIEQLINQKVHLRMLDDSEIADFGQSEEEALEVEDSPPNSDIELVEKPAPRKKAASKGSASGPVLKAVHEVAAGGATTSRTSGRRAQISDFMSTISSSLNPAAREVRDETRFARRLAQEEISRLTQENRDLRQRTEMLTDRIHEQSIQLQQQLSETTRLRTQVDMYEMMRSFGGRQSRFPVGALDAEDWDFDTARYRHPSSSSYFHHQRPRPYSPPRTPRFHRPLTPLTVSPSNRPDIPGDGAGSSRRRRDVRRPDMDQSISPRSHSPIPSAPPTSRSANVATNTMHPPSLHSSSSFTSAGPPSVPSLNHFSLATGTNLETLANVASSSEGPRATSPVAGPSFTFSFSPSRSRKY